MALPYSDPDASTDQPTDAEKKTMDREAFKVMIERVKREHPLSGTTEKKRPVLYRSKLIEYEKQHGKPFTRLEAYEIVEDVDSGDILGTT